MYLIHTRRLRLQYFSAPPAEYAILSHVWTNRELSFQEAQRYTGESPSLGANGGKVQAACRYAVSEGFEWLWVDTCCIDKTNSNDLSEAINCMYSWYASATVCYAYLADVPTVRRTADYASSFVKSKWHTRGWTLQELIAPAEVRFLSAQWKYIGNKALLAPLLQQITGIPDHILEHGDLSSTSLAERLSWASQRSTTRQEDEAYCLMGLFNVNIPVIYGEGRRAFRRLQEEIVRTSPDQTLFAWGRPMAPSSTICLCTEGAAPPYGQDSNLLASGPSSFGGGNGGSFRGPPRSLSFASFLQTLEVLLKRPRPDSPRKVSSKLQASPL